MSKCSCNKTTLYPEYDDGVGGPVWPRIEFADALANLADEIAKLQNRVALLEQTVLDNTWLDTRVEELENTIKDMEADS